MAEKALVNPDGTADNAIIASADLRPLIDLVLDSVKSEHSRRAYERALTDFLGWCLAMGRPEFNKATVQRYRTVLQDSGLAPSSINQRLSAIRKLAEEAADNGKLDAVLASGIARVEGVTTSGVRAGNWLTRAQAQALINTPDCSTLKGLRDRAILAVLLGTGLRRSELCALKIANIQQREGRPIVVDLVGKHRRVRSVPIPTWAKAAIDLWTREAGIQTGLVFRSVLKSGKLARASITPQAIHDIVVYYGKGVGLDVKPHDLRRTFAKLARNGGAALEQIQLTLGHARLDTTQRYLGSDLDIVDAVCDHLQIAPDGSDA